MEEIEQIQQQLIDEHNKYLMAMADIANIRKHYQKREADFAKYQYEGLVKELLPILDDYERLAMAGDASTGSNLILSKLVSALNKIGIKKIVPQIGDAFDADYMEAAAVFPEPEHVNTIKDVMQVGYIYKDKIIRYPKVVVCQ